jgi:hypothetical protein
VAFAAPVAARAGGKAAASKRASSTTAAATSAEQQREAIEAIKGQRKATEESAAAEESSAEKAPPTFRLERAEPAPAGAGIVLGVLLWAVAITYIRGGTPQVKTLLRAKFLNKTD